MTRNIDNQVIAELETAINYYLGNIGKCAVQALQAYLNKDQDAFWLDLEDYESIDELAETLFELLQEDVDDTIAKLLALAGDESKWTQADRDALSKQLSVEEGLETVEEVVGDAAFSLFPFETSGDWLEDLDQFNCLENSG